jgi:RNA polymerase sigma-70 factor (ECF subfamily)
MPTTSLTLLDRLRQPDQTDAWDRFAKLYAPLLLRWATLQGFQSADAEDLVQITLLKLIRVLPSYQKQDGRPFRSWLFTICRNECRDFRSRRATRSLPSSHGLADVASPNSATELGEAEYRRWLVHQVLGLIRSDFTPATWAAFHKFVLEGCPASEVAREVGISVNAVYLARNRVLTRIREELAGLID